MPRNQPERKTNERSEEYRCRFCDETFLTQDGLDEHVGEAHSEQLQEEEP